MNRVGVAAVVCALVWTIALQAFATGVFLQLCALLRG